MTYNNYNNFNDCFYIISLLDASFYAINENNNNTYCKWKGHINNKANRHCRLYCLSRLNQGQRYYTFTHYGSILPVNIDCCNILHHSKSINFSA